MNAPLVDTRRSPHARLRPVGVRDVTLTRGLLKERQAIVSAASIPAGWHELRQSHTLDNFLVAAGHKSGSIKPPVFRDSDAYKWIEAASWDLVHGPNPETEGWVAHAIDLIEAAQEPDGYLNTHYSGELKSLRFTNLRNDHELYCAGHLFQAAVAHHRVTGSDQLLRVACRLADCLVDRFGTRGTPGACGHPEAEMALVELYRATGRGDYLELAQRMVEARGQSPSALTGEAPCPPTYFLDHLPLGEQREAVGHAVRAVYLYAGVADLVAETGNLAHLVALEALWQDLFTRKVYVTGGLGARHDWESLGAAYELTNERAYSETCAAIGGLMWNLRMLHLEPDARYADAMETALYNAILAGISLDGTRFFYHNPLASRGGVERQPWFDCACCPPNLERTLASLGGTLFSVDERGLFVHLYAASSLHTELPDGRPVALTVDTDYPWDGRITLHPSAGRYRLALRIPAWARAAIISINGQRQPIAAESGTYVELDRTWVEGDRVVLDLVMPVEMLLCNERVDNNRNAGAIRRGPLVYCLEGPDSPDAEHLVAVSEPPEEVQRGGSWLPDAVLLGGQIQVARAPASLYARRDQASSPAWQARPAQWVPYFAWANRGPHPMRVWIPLA